MQKAETVPLVYLPTQIFSPRGHFPKKRNFCYYKLCAKAFLLLKISITVYILEMRQLNPTQVK